MFSKVALTRMRNESDTRKQHTVPDTGGLKYMSSSDATHDTTPQNITSQPQRENSSAGRNAPELVEGELSLNNLGHD